MKLLVCGGAGFIGSAFIRNFLKNNVDSTITNLDVLTIGSNLANLKDLEKNQNYNFIKDDIRNETKIDGLIKDTDIVVNFAAESHVDRSIANPKSFLETNILGTYTILEGIRKYNKYFIHVSTDELHVCLTNLLLLGVRLVLLNQLPEISILPTKSPRLWMKSLIISKWFPPILIL